MSVDDRHPSVLDDEQPFGDDPFFAVPRTEVPTSVGVVRMPALCREVVVRMPMWLVEVDRAGALMKHTGIRPRQFGRWAIVAVSMFDYGFSSVGPYREVGILVAGRKGRDTGLFAVELALTGDTPRVGGIELLGLPKYLAEVTSRRRGDRFDFAVRRPGSTTSSLSVSGRIGPGIVAPSPTLRGLSLLDGRVVRTDVETDSSWRIGPALGTRLTCDPDDGHIGGHATALGLDRRRPFCVLAADDLRGRLNLPVPVR